MERAEAYLPTGFFGGYQMPADTVVLCTTRECRSSQGRFFLTTFSEYAIETIRSCA